jgi:hypothetical protein
MLIVQIPANSVQLDVQRVLQQHNVPVASQAMLLTDLYARQVV